MIFDLLKDLGEALEAIPQQHPKRRIVDLLEDALRRDLHVIQRDSTTLFQCLWNSCWWYDCSEAANHYVEPDEGWSKPPPWTATSGKLCVLLESWRAARAALSIGRYWVRSLRPPSIHLGVAGQTVLRGHVSRVVGVAFSADGRRIFSGDQEQGIVSWDAESGAKLSQFQAHESWINCVSISSDGRLIVSGSGQPFMRADRTVRIWDAETGTERRRFVGHEAPIFGAEFSPDARLVASVSGDKTVRVWDVETGDVYRVLSGHEEDVVSVAFSPDGKRVASGSRDQTIRIWDLETGAQLRRICGHGGSVECVAFSPDGRLLASGSSDKRLLVWYSETGVKLGQFCHQGGVVCLAFSPDGKRIASGSFDNTIRLWTVPDCLPVRQVEIRRLLSNRTQINTQTPICRLRGHEASVESLAFSPDGESLVSGSADHTVRLWDMEQGADLRELDVQFKYFSQVAYSPDGRRIISFTGRYGVSASISSDGRRIAVATGGDNHCVVWDTETACVLRQFACGNFQSGKKVIVCDLDSGDELCVFYGHQNRVSCVEFSPDGRHVVSGCADKTLQLWNAKTGAKLRRYPGIESRVSRVAFSPDGRRVACSPSDGMVRVWDVETADQVACLNGHRGTVGSFAFSTDGRRLVSGGQDQTIRVWDISTGAELRTVHDTGGWVFHVSFSADGSRIVSGHYDDIGSESYDETARIWDVETGECLEVIKSICDLESVSAEPQQSPHQAVFRGDETVVVDRRTGDLVVRFPVSLTRAAVHPSGNIWAGSGPGSHLEVFKLERD